MPTLLNVTNELLITRRGIFNEPRNIAVYLLRQIRGENLNNIGEMFNIKAYSTVSGIIRRISRLKKYNRKIKKQIGKIQDSITWVYSRLDPFSSQRYL